MADHESLGWVKEAAGAGVAVAGGLFTWIFRTSSKQATLTQSLEDFKTSTNGRLRDSSDRLVRIEAKIDRVIERVTMP